MFNVTDVRKRLKLGEIVCDSLQLVDEINKIRKFEEEKTGKKRAILKHNDFIKKIREYNKKIREYNDIAKELDEGIISHDYYKDTLNRKQEKFLFTESQARIFIADESIVGKIMLSKFINTLFVEN